MQALVRLNARICRLIVCIFVLSGYDAVHAMALEDRVKELHGSLVILKNKLTALKDGLEEIKGSLSGAKKVRPLPPTPSSDGKLATPGSKKKPPVLPLADMIEKLKKDFKFRNSNSATFNLIIKNEPLLIHNAIEKLLTGQQNLLEEPEWKILARVVVLKDQSLLESSSLAILEKIKNKTHLNEDEAVLFKRYYKFMHSEDAKAFLAKIKPKVTLVDVAPSSGSLPVSGPATLVTPVESSTPPVGAPKSPPPAPKLPDTPLSSGGSKSTPVKKPSVSGPAPVSITDQIKSKGMGYLKKLSEEDIEKDKARRAEELAKKQQEKDKVAGEASTQTKAAAADSMFESLKANLGKRAEAIQGSDDDDEYPPGYWD